MQLCKERSAEQCWRCGAGSPTYMHKQYVQTVDANTVLNGKSRGGAYASLMPY
jgi:hypothetical protein